MQRASAPFDVLPRDVPGYQDALARGQVRPVPDNPPELLAGRSASTIAWSVVGEFAAAIVTLSVLARAIPEGAAILGAEVRGVAMLAGLLVWAAVVIGDVRSLVRRVVAEVDAGYLTTSVLAAQLSLRGNSHYPRRFAYGDLQTPWNCSGTWILHGRTGQVVQEPDRRFDAPGFYPSPYRPGLLELWTGAGWADQYRRSGPSS